MFCVRSGSQYFLHYEEQVKQVPARTLLLKSFIQPHLYASVGNIYLQHASAEYFGRVNLSYHFYFLSKDIKLFYVIAFTNDGSFANQK